MGRPATDLTPRQIKAACKNREKGWSISRIAEVMGIPASTLHRKLHSVPAFWDASTRAEKAFLSEDRETLHDMASGRCKEVEQTFAADGSLLKTRVTQLGPDFRALAQEMAILDPEHSNPNHNVSVSGTKDFGAWVAAMTQKHEEESR